ncbi:hypothetical protein TrCOL_g408 [Triparma columacea]|uniref:Nudix hydrolase domain-containing protein n=1 Tax=Triparma columacea TaxID=722753 RepID=A0A9W7LE22_9STRA|nr:hypothetical protein TrCOL_g408 [Triparma columacea]
MSAKVDSKVPVTGGNLGLVTTSADVLNERAFGSQDNVRGILDAGDGKDGERTRKKAKRGEGGLTSNWGEGSMVTVSSDGFSGSERGADSPTTTNGEWGGTGSPPKDSQTVAPTNLDGTPIFVGVKGGARQGRDNQRWDGPVRLVVGCVPIVKDGGILLCSSSKKKEWILPKGGWEKDETVEEGAQRETYEEAGVYGYLGPKLEDISYEGRKQKEAASPVPWNEGDVMEGKGQDAGTNNATPQDPAGESKAGDGEGTLATTPTGGNVRKCRAAIFPIYVREVLEDWPEKGRARKIVSIDEAIEIVKREELKKALREVKSRNLHLQGKEV